MDPKSGRPHPRVRIENAFTEMKIRIDPDGSAESQGEAAVKKMRGPILFGRAAQLTGTVMIKHQYYGKVSHILGAYKFENESWGKFNFTKSKKIGTCVEISKGSCTIRCPHVLGTRCI